MLFCMVCCLCFISQENIQSRDSITCLDTERTHSEGQRCFAVVASDVLVYHLQDGDCQQHIKNAHNVEITHIMFYKPLKVRGRLHKSSFDVVGKITKNAVCRSVFLTIWYCILSDSM